ncbi:hypothetical protein [Halovivax gelatinilyticus]|uniref:hypothetical protein n=1 Tax=Halovivax gelatinilyticus TaxID=2961597 RepID=UPI0020CA6D25|nr:hypothetical protein [Halovivax gelatinilyticus]
MAAILGDIETDQGPPLSIPIRHFVVGFGFLLLGVAVGMANGLGLTPPTAMLANVHLLLVGWVCVTIMGAMVQFVPVWSNTSIHSRRLSVVQLWLVAGGLTLFVGALLTERLAFLAIGGSLVLLGFWVFVYNVGRTLLGVRPWDVTERHFALALCFFLALSSLGLLLALGFARPIFADLPVDHGAVLASHVTFAVFGAVLTTVIGALYQLATMFTQTEFYALDRHIQRFESVAYPIGVVGLALGRLFELSWLARGGGVLIVASIFGIGLFLARRLYLTRVDWTPMLTRYTVVAGAMVTWAALTLPAWLSDPLSPAARYGAPGTVHLLTFGLIAFVVLGTLYHVVPFIVWVHRYSDLLGLEPVPMIDDLYDDTVAALDFVFLFGGTVCLVVADQLALASPLFPVGTTAIAIGAALFVANMGLVVTRHSPDGVGTILFGERAVRRVDRTVED